MWGGECLEMEEERGFRGRGRGPVAWLAREQPKRALKLVYNNIYKIIYYFYIHFLIKIYLFLIFS